MTDFCAPMTTEYQKYLDRQQQLESEFGQAACDALQKFIDRLPANLLMKVADSVGERLGTGRTVARIGGMEFEGFLQDRGVFRKAAAAGVWSDDILSIFRSFFQRRGGGSYIDFGANIGLTITPVCRDFGVARGYAVEANPDNARLLRLNLLRNDINNVDVLHIAIGDAAGSLEMELSERNFGDHRIRRSDVDKGEDGDELYDEAGRVAISVPADTADAIFADYDLPKPLAIKSDMQGSDAFLFSHGKSLLSRCELMVMEYWPYALKRIGVSPADLHAGIAATFPYGHIVATDLWRPGLSLLPVAELTALLTERYAVLDGASAQQRTQHDNIILSRSPQPA